MPASDEAAEGLRIQQFIRENNQVSLKRQGVSEMSYVACAKGMIGVVKDAAVWFGAEFDERSLGRVTLEQGGARAGDELAEEGAR